MYARRMNASAGWPLNIPRRKLIYSSCFTDMATVRSFLSPKLFEGRKMLTTVYGASERLLNSWKTVEIPEKS